MLGTESKLIIYTVLAITLGYLFVSAIPAQLASQEQQMLVQRESDDTNGQLSEDIESSGDVLGGDSGGNLSSESPSCEASESAKSALEESSAGGITIDYISIFGTLSLNLLIAFVVYLVARRRLT